MKRLAIPAAGLAIGAAGVNAAFEISQNKRRLDCGEITRQEFIKRGERTFGSLVPEPITKAVVACDQLVSDYENDDLTVTGVVSAISAQIPFDPVGIAKAGYNIYLIADYLLESRNVLNNTSLTGNEMETEFKKLHNKLAGSPRLNRKH
jgi:hypothetical protein